MYMYLHTSVVSDTRTVLNVMGLYIYDKFFLFEIPPVASQDPALKASGGDLLFLATKLAHILLSHYLARLFIGMH
jgi:hypothetical protein